MFSNKLLIQIIHTFEMGKMGPTKDILFVYKLVEIINKLSQLVLININE